LKNSDDYEEGKAAR